MKRIYKYAKQSNWLTDRFLLTDLFFKFKSKSSVIIAIIIKLVKFSCVSRKENEGRNNNNCFPLAYTKQLATFRYHKKKIHKSNKVNLNSTGTLLERICNRDSEINSTLQFRFLPTTFLKVKQHLFRKKFMYRYPLIYKFQKLLEFLECHGQIQTNPIIRLIFFDFFRVRKKWRNRTVITRMFNFLQYWWLLSDKKWYRLIRWEKYGRKDRCTHIHQLGDF